MPLCQENWMVWQLALSLCFLAPSGSVYRTLEGLVKMQKHTFYYYPLFFQRENPLKRSIQLLYPRCEERGKGPHTRIRHAALKSLLWRLEFQSGFLEDLGGWSLRRDSGTGPALHTFSHKAGIQSGSASHYFPVKSEASRPAGKQGTHLSRQSLRQGEVQPPRQLSRFV